MEKILCIANLIDFFVVVIFSIWDAGDRPCWLLRQTIILFQIAPISSWFLKHCALQHLYSSFGSRWSQSYLEYLSSRCLEYSIDRSGGPKLSEKNISENTDGCAAAAAAYTTMLFPKTSKLYYYIIITIIYYFDQKSSCKTLSTDRLQREKNHWKRGRKFLTIT